MNDFALRIEKGLHRKESKSGRQTFEEILFHISNNTSNSVSDLLSLPIPLVLSIYDSVNSDIKRINKANKK